MQASVVIPTYNRLEPLKRAVDSVLNQTQGLLELIIVDDGSTDGTGDWVSELSNTDARVKLVQQTNRGVSAARNAGITICQSDWIAFLDSDDEWLPQKLKKQFERIAGKPDTQVIHGEEIWIRNGIRVNQHKKHAKSGGWIFEKCIPLCAMSPSTIMIHKEVFGNIGTFNEDFIVCEDYELWLKITAKYPVEFIEEPIIKKFGGHDDQLSQKYRAMDYWRVKALFQMRNSAPSTEAQSQLIKTLLKKTEILLKGFERHQNFTHQDEVLEIRNITLKEYPLGEPGHE